MQTILQDGSFLISEPEGLMVWKSNGKRVQKKHLHDGIGAFVCLKFCTSARKIKPFR